MYRLEGMDTMTVKTFNELFTQDVVNQLFPEDRADHLFDALFGDVAEGAYDIKFAFKEHRKRKLEFDLQLKQRPGKCLHCNLTYGLPKVFSRHPIINISGLVKDIEQLLNGRATCTEWELGSTKEVSSELHVIPLTISLEFEQEIY
jgi:hypothetical protein